MRVYFIDGDNGPGSRTCGIEWLTKDDTVKLFYASANKYYSEERKKSISDQTTAAVEFYKISAGKNAVDFAIAAEAGKVMAEQKVDQIYLVSGDNHFRLIAKLLQEGQDGTNIERIDTILSGFLLEPEKLSTLEQAAQIIQRNFGEKIGKGFFKRLKVLMQEEQLSRNKVQQSCNLSKDKMEREEQDMNQNLFNIGDRVSFSVNDTIYDGEIIDIDGEYGERGTYFVGGEPMVEEATSIEYSYNIWNDVADKVHYGVPEELILMKAEAINPTACYIVREKYALIAYEMRGNTFWRKVRLEKYPDLCQGAVLTFYQGKEIWYTGMVVPTNMADVLLAERCGDKHPLMGNEKFMEFVENHLLSEESEICKIDLTPMLVELIYETAQHLGICMGETIHHCIGNLVERWLITGEWIVDIGDGDGEPK